MLDLASPTTTDVAPLAAQAPRWSWVSRVGFRFSIVYFGLFVLTTQMLGGLLMLPNRELPPLQELPS